MSHTHTGLVLDGVVNKERTEQNLGHVLTLCWLVAREHSVVRSRGGGAAQDPGTDPDAERDREECPVLMWCLMVLCTTICVISVTAADAKQSTHAFCMQHAPAPACQAHCGRARQFTLFTKFLTVNLQQLTIRLTGAQSYLRTAYVRSRKQHVRFLRITGKCRFFTTFR